MKNKGVLYALCAGISWGISLGIFGRTMTSFGFTAMQVSAVRTTISAITFIILALVTDRKAFRLNPKDIWIFLCSGFISVTLFCWCYFTSTRLCSLAVGGVLQYTAPVWVVVFSAVIFKEPITKVKAAAMLVAIAGCVLVSGITHGVGQVSAFGLVAGVFSGITYGSYTIFTRFAVPKYRTMTINVYTFIVASATSLLLSGPVRDRLRRMHAKGAAGGDNRRHNVRRGAVLLLQQEPGDAGKRKSKHTGYYRAGDSRNGVGILL